MFGYVRIIAYLKENKPNFHVHRFMQAWNLGASYFAQKYMKDFLKIFQEGS